MPTRYFEDLSIWKISVNNGQNKPYGTKATAQQGYPIRSYKYEKHNLLQEFYRMITGSIITLSIAELIAL